MVEKIHNFSLQELISENFLKETMKKGTFDFFKVSSLFRENKTMGESFFNPAHVSWKVGNCLVWTP